MADALATIPARALRQNDIDHALALHRSGDLAAAAEACLDILSDNRMHGPALQLLGVIHALEGRATSSETLLKQAMSVLPNSPDVWNNLGSTLHNQGRFQEAIDCFQSAVRLQPDYSMALKNLAASHQALGQNEEAIKNYDLALATSPNQPDALFNLALLLFEARRFKDAVRQLKAAVALDPSSIDARLSLGKALTKSLRFAEAADCFRAILAERPECALAYIGQGDIQQSLNKHEAAVRHYSRAIQAKPPSALAYVKLGSALQELGHLAAARQSFLRSIQIEPRRPAHYLVLSQVHTFKPEQPEWNGLLQLKQEIGSLTALDQIDLHFTLGKAYSDVGDPGQGFHHFVAGNALKRLRISYDEAKVRALVDQTVQVFTPSLAYSRDPSVGSRAYSPVFIVSMPRSGSTLVEQIIASHPKVYGTGETRSFVNAARTARLFGDHPQYPMSILHASVSDFDKIANDYIQRLCNLKNVRSLDKAVTHITDKTMTNFRYVGLIKLVFPDARIIHISRDPVNTCLSCFCRQFEWLPYSSDLGELGRYYSGYRRLMTHWSVTLPQGSMLEVCYEDLVQNFDYEARRLIAYCGLEWTDQCSRFYETSRLVRTASVAQVRQPLYQHALTRWRPPAAIIQPLLEALDVAAMEV